MSMQTTTLSAQIRTASGKGPARQLRFKGLIPAVCYGKSDKPVHLAVDPEKLAEAIATPHKFNTVIKLEIEGGQSRTVLFKDYEKDPLDGRVLHADFLDVRMDQEVVVQVPVILTGRPAGAAEGGILQQVARTLPVLCLPGNIPVKIEVDVSHLNIAESMHVSDIKAPAGVKFKVDGGATIAVVAIPEKEEVKAVVAAPGAEGAAAAVGADGKPAPEGKAAPDGKAAPAAAGKDAPKAAKK
ncbi:MAG: 50S ribosomal protein L25 [Deltaproteobacteria bacterium]|nr:50S ribosomal protein L25 [Deltaproteobacteria bacterium]